MNTTHTPGPWKLDTEYSPANVSATVNGEEVGLAKVYLTNPKTRRREPQYAANARLMTTSPELFAFVLRYLESEKADGVLGGPMMEEANRLIAKVEGMRLESATLEELEAWYLREIDGNAEGALGPLEAAREACQKAAVESMAHGAAHDFAGHKASRGETAGTLADYVAREFSELFDREPDPTSEHDTELLQEATTEAEASI